MAVKQVFIVRRGNTECFRALRQAFGTPPLSAKITWDRRKGDRRRRSEVVPSDGRRAERRGSEPSSWSVLDFLVTGPTGEQPAADGFGSAQAPVNRSRTTVDSRPVLDHAMSELRDLPYSFWCEVVTDQSSFTRPMPDGAGRLDVDAGWHQGTKDIHVTITFKRGWRRGVSDGFTITPTNQFR